MEKILDKRLLKLKECGILPENTYSFTPEQQNVYDELLHGINDIEHFILKHLDLANNETKQQVLHKKITHKKNERKNKGIYINIEPYDIEINEFCPFFETKLNYNSTIGRGTSFRDPHAYSIDRIDNSKGYVKGNVMILSRLANTMKRDATIPELKTFCTNIIKIYNDRQKS